VEADGVESASFDSNISGDTMPQTPKIKFLTLLMETASVFALQYVINFQALTQIFSHALYDELRRTIDMKFKMSLNCS